MRVKAVCKILDTYFDANEKKILLFCDVTTLSMKKVLVFDVDDFNPRGRVITDQEVQQTIPKWKGKFFNWVMDDDEKIAEYVQNPTEFVPYEKVFIEEVGNKMMEAAEAMNTETWKEEYLKQRLIEKEKEARQKLKEVGGL